MNTSTERAQRTKTRRAAKAGLTAILLGGMLAVTGFVSAPAGAAGNDHQITICHATASQDNPYSSPSPNKWQIMAPNGHGFDANDIIPAFPAGSKGNHSWAAFDGLNWDAEGQALLARGCATEAPEAGSVTLDKVTAGDNRPAGTMPFDFTVSCEGEAVTVADTTTFTADAVATPVATGLAEGDTCTIDESAEAKAAAVSTTFSVNGGDEQAGPVVVTLEAADEVISVVVTNTYACPTGQVADDEGGCATPQVDVCPEAGVQTSVTECPVEVQGDVVTPSTPATPAAPAVEAAAQTRATNVAGEQLPRTGSSTTALAEIGLGLVLLGAGALLFDRKQTITV